jgi:hypothetical protein
MPFLNWARSSLLGHIVLFELLFSLPEFLIFEFMNYRDGALTVTGTLRIAITAVVGGAVFATLVWFTISLPFRRRLKREKGDNESD